jgi:hypothetical protein
MATHEVHIRNGQAYPDPLDHVLNGHEVTFHSDDKDYELKFPPGLGFGNKEHVPAGQDGEHSPHKVKAKHNHYSYTITSLGQVNDPMIIVDDDPLH